MDNFLPKQPKATKRVCLRIPVNILAEIFIEQRFYKKVRVNNLSTTGLAFCVKETERLPDCFELRFRLSFFSKEIRVRVDVKNRIKVSRGFKIGCVFVNLPERDQNIVKNYISKYANLSVPFGVVNLAAFLCLADALLRIVAHLITCYYGVTELGGNFGALFLHNFYIITLILYAIISFTSLIFTDKIIDKKSETRFMIGVLCLGAAFIFSIVKNIIYWESAIRFFNYPFIGLFLRIHTFVILYLGFSITMWLVSVKRVKVVLDIEATYRSYFPAK